MYLTGFFVFLAGWLGLGAVFAWYGLTRPRLGRARQKAIAGIVAAGLFVAGIITMAVS